METLKELLEKISIQIKADLLSGNFLVHGYNTYNGFEVNLFVANAFSMTFQLNHSLKIASPNSMLGIYMQYFEKEDQERIYSFIIAGGVKQMIMHKELQLKAIEKELEFLKNSL